jgi:PTH1 family peptidyl-tRNA hydrolase
MKLIVGLGNPGAKYAQTRHNLGFMVLDHIAEHLEAKFEVKFDSLVAKANAMNQDLVLAKPQTMMNLSGRAIQRIAAFYKIEPGDIWVIHDDIDLGFGKLRVRQGGSSGGHNGLKSIIEQIGDGFARFKIGVANNQLRQPIDPEHFVLQSFADDESNHLPQIVSGTAEQVAGHLRSQSLQDTTYNLITK